MEGEGITGSSLQSYSDFRLRTNSTSPEFVLPGKSKLLASLPEISKKSSTSSFFEISSARFVLPFIRSSTRKSPTSISPDCETNQLAFEIPTQRTMITA